MVKITKKTVKKIAKSPAAKQLKKEVKGFISEYKEKMQISINPPPPDGCCEHCGKSVKELKPFGKAGDPLVGDFDGALLVKTLPYRIVGKYIRNHYK